MRYLLRSAALVMLLIFPAGLISAQSIQVNHENKTIAISTSDEATATADVAAITIGYEIFGPDAETLSANAGKMSEAILVALKGVGVEEKSIESKNQGVARNNDFDEKENDQSRAAKKFKFIQSWEVSVPPNMASEVIRVSIAAGANTSGNIEWRLADRKALQAKAAELALIKASNVAQKMAEGLHVKLGSLIYASNESMKTQLYFKPNYRYGVFNTLSASVSSVVPKGIVIRPITIREEATVSAVFAIE